MGITIGIVGAGEFADKFIPLFQAHPDVDEVRLAELVPRTCARKLAALDGITKTYASSEELCACPDVDAVAIFTQRWTHGPLRSKLWKQASTFTRLYPWLVRWTKSGRSPAYWQRATAST